MVTKQRLLSFMQVVTVVFLLMGASLTAFAQDSFKEQARQAVIARNYSQALDILNRAHNRGQADIESYQLLADVYLNLGNGIPAEAAIDRARQLGADFSSVVVPYAKALLIQGKFAAALGALRGVIVPEDQRLNALIISGDAYFATGDLDAARRNYETAKTQFPDDYQAYLGLARLALRANRLNEAEQLADQAHERDTSNTMVEFTRGLVARYTNRPSEAEKHFLDAVRLLPGNLMANLELANIRIEQQRLEEAESYLDIVYQSAPKNPMAIYLSGVILANRGQFAEADTLLKRVRNLTDNFLPAMYVQGLLSYQLNELDDALLYLTKVLQARPNDRQVRLALAGTYLKLQLPAQGLSVMEPLIQSNPDDSSIVEMMAALRIAAGQVEEGKALYEKLETLSKENTDKPFQGLDTKVALAQFVAGETEKALITLSTATAGQEAQLQELGILGSMQLRTQDFVGAETTIAKIITAAPQRALGYNMRGSLQFAQRQYQQAIVSFTQALDRESNYYTARRNRGLAYMNLGSYREAENDLKSLLAAQPNDVRAKAALGKVLLENRKPEEAVSYFREAVEKLGFSAELWADYSQALADSGNTTRAIEEARRTAIRAEDQPVILRRMGELLLRLDQARAAERPLSRYAAFYPNNGTAQLLHARALLKNGLHTGARAILARAMKATEEPVDPDVLEWYFFEADALSQRYNEAEARLASLKSEKRPTDVPADLVGGVFLAQGDADAAVSAYRTAMRTGPTENIVIGLSRALNRLGRRDEGIAELETFIARNKNARQTRLELAAQYEAAGDRLLDAGRQYEAILQSGVADAEVVAKLALIYRTIGNRTSVPLAERAYLMAPDDPFILYVSGVVALQASNDPIKAIEFLDRAGRRAPGNALYKFELARAYYAVGNFVEARKLTEQALSLNPDFPEASDARRLLNELNN